MIPNVRMLDRVTAPQPELDKPKLADVEAAVRTLIRWTGEDPDRDGLVETPARVARSFEEFFSDTGRTRLRFWKRRLRRSKATTK
jgi:GTP cyclohydrolase I